MFRDLVVQRKQEPQNFAGWWRNAQRKCGPWHRVPLGVMILDRPVPAIAKQTHCVEADCSGGGSKKVARAGI